MIFRAVCKNAEICIVNSEFNSDPSAIFQKGFAERFIETQIDMDGINTIMDGNVFKAFS
jgi:hypothetical protein